MASPYTTTHLVQSILRRGYFGAGTGMTATQMLAWASEEQSLYVMAFLKGLREEFTVVPLELAVTEDTVSLPVRAAGGALRTATWFPGAQTSQSINLVRIEPEQRPYFDNVGPQPYGYLFQGNNLVLLPNPATGTLRLSYQQRLSRLVLPEECGEIEAIDTGTGEVTLVDVPSDFDDSETYDFVSNTPNFVTRGIDEEAVSIVGDVITFDELPAGLAVGDWVCLAGETPIPQLPTEVHFLLAQRTAEVIAASQGSARLKDIRDELQQARADATALLSPRNDGSPRPIIRVGGLGSGWGW